MKNHKKMSRALLSVIALQTAMLPAQLNAFRAPDVPKVNSHTVKVKKMDKSESLQLIRISEKDLKRKINGIVSDDILALAQAIFNSNVTQALSATLGKMASGTASSLATIRKEQKDKLGFQHIRVVQTYQNLPVIGAELVFHLDKKNTLYAINGKYQPKLDIDITPSVSANEATQKGMTEQQGEENLHIDKKPTLVIYNKKLAWFYTLRHDGSEPGNWYYYVDAKSGKILNRYNNIMHNAPVESNGAAADITGRRLSGEDNSTVTINGFKENTSGSNNYFLYSFDHKWGIYDTDAADWEQNASNNWHEIDQAAISCAKNMETTQNYVLSILDRNSFDNNGGFARSDIHVGDNYVNAYWDGSKFNFGDGDGTTATPLTVLDVAAHEYGHAITQNTSNLVYQDESGALNEAYSDILGVAVEFHAQADGTSAYPHATPGKSDWLMGEDCWVSSDALRDMEDPQRYGQPSYYMGTNWYSGTNDHGGVHTNSGVANFAFYLLAMGGNGDNDGHAYNIAGIGIAKAAEVALRANYYYHTSTSTYEDARTDWIQAAKDLGYNAQTVGDVWKACGVFPPVPCNTKYIMDGNATYGFEDISTTGTDLNLSDDQTKTITLPFDFKFYCDHNDTLNINSNGTLSLTSISNEFENSAIPTSVFPDLIAPLWDDLDPSAGGKVYWETKGEAPHRRVVIQWNNVPHYDETDGITFEVILFEGSNKILFQYKDIDFGNVDEDFGKSATVGIQRNSKEGILYLYNEAKLKNDSAILFTPHSKTVMEPIYYLLF